jgi:hypothetical protein
VKNGFSKHHRASGGALTRVTAALAILAAAGLAGCADYPEQEAAYPDYAAPVYGPYGPCYGPCYMPYPYYAFGPGVYFGGFHHHHHHDQRR